MTRAPRRRSFIGTTPPLARYYVDHLMYHVIYEDLSGLRGVREITGHTGAGDHALPPDVLTLRDCNATVVPRLLSPKGPMDVAASTVVREPANAPRGLKSRFNLAPMISVRIILVVVILLTTRLSPRDPRGRGGPHPASRLRRRLLRDVSGGMGASLDCGMANLVAASGTAASTMVKLAPG